jgi:hypothetical protein
MVSRTRPQTNSWALTFRHFANVVFMEVLAGITLLAETLEPVLANNASGAAVFVVVLVGLAKVEVRFEPGIKRERKVLGCIEVGSHRA